MQPNQQQHLTDAEQPKKGGPRHRAGRKKNRGGGGKENLAKGGKESQAGTWAARLESSNTDLNSNASRPMQQLPRSDNHSQADKNMISSKQQQQLTLPSSGHPAARKEQRWSEAGHDRQRPQQANEQPPRQLPEQRPRQLDTQRPKQSSELGSRQFDQQISRQLNEQRPRQLDELKVGQSTQQLQHQGFVTGIIKTESFSAPVKSLAGGQEEVVKFSYAVATTGASDEKGGLQAARRFASDQEDDEWVR